MIGLSRRANAIQPSATMAISARAIALRREGRDVVSLSVGEPDFPIFPHVAAAIDEAIRKGQTKYTPSAGTAELREAISDWLFKDLAVRFTPQQIIATAGAKQGLYNACQVLLDDGDEVVVPSPAWVSYPEMARLAGATVVELPLSADHGWVPRASELERVLTPKTRLIMLGSPSNPTGAVWPEAALRELAAVLVKFPKVAILSDDIYDKLTYGGVKQHSLLTVAPQLAPRLVLINGCSKAYAMTGLRLGWAAGPAEIVHAMGKVQDASTSNPSSLSQAAAIAALRGPQEPLEEMRRAFERRRDLMVELLGRVPGVRCARPDGAYYAFPDVTALLTKRYRGLPISTSQRLAELLLEEHGVAVVPGSAFGREGYLRLSFATSDELIKKALQRFEAAARALE
jgi:aspartate aminotransferase